MFVDTFDCLYMTTVDGKMVAFDSLKDMHSDETNRQKDFIPALLCFMSTLHEETEYKGH